MSEDSDPNAKLLEQFLRDRSPKAGIVVGIDPGISGGIALLSAEPRRLVVAFDIPTVSYPTDRKTKKGQQAHKSEYDLDRILNVFMSLEPYAERVHIFLERYHLISPTAAAAIAKKGRGFRPGAKSAYGGDTVTTAARVAASVEMWPLYFRRVGFALSQVQSSVWKKAMGLSRDKKASRMLAQKLWPGTGCFALKSKDGRAEAALIAEFGRRKLSGEA